MICGASSSSSVRTARSTDRSPHERRRIEQRTLEIKQITLVSLENVGPRCMANVLVQDALVNPHPRYCALRAAKRL